ncbi:unnamed protein product [Vitrella brassicaformis CCMP3155]|uniref:Ubiquitin-like protease family profile domain-containing protein n=1 Tax=Vitrella brassicaformis (strain CCMP3155) TaxID=1169540 RepID=A0A0G4GJY7_VITBC|nr:unnamed protein product [Vitrella brassicaformis CCMP3155]|eukprot:CEM30219.1 unnamed protein product [Vitrella brassicaformis CCMP3155]
MGPRSSKRILPRPIRLRGCARSWKRRTRTRSTTTSRQDKSESRSRYTCLPNELANEVVDAIFTLAADRQHELRQSGRAFPRVRFTPTDFWQKLAGPDDGYKYNYEAVKSRNNIQGISVFEVDYLAVPICDHGHWSLGFVDVRRRRVGVLDTDMLPSEDTSFHFLHFMIDYMRDAYRDLFHREMPFGEFRQWCEADDELDLQQQAYEEDSGIWMLLFGFCLMTRTPFASVRPRSSFLRLTGDWSQDQTALMDIVRRKMILSLYRKHLPAEVFDSAADREMSEGDEGAVVSPTASIGDEEFFSLDPPPPEQRGDGFLHFMIDYMRDAYRDSFHREMPFGEFRQWCEAGQMQHHHQVADPLRDECWWFADSRGTHGPQSQRDEDLVRCWTRHCRHLRGRQPNTIGAAVSALSPRAVFPNFAPGGRVHTDG